MCCDICPYYDECEGLGKVKEACCSECPDYQECLGAEAKKGSGDDEEA